MKRNQLLSLVTGLVCLINVNGLALQDNLKSELIKKYIKEKNIQFLNYVFCNISSDILPIISALNTYSIRISFNMDKLHSLKSNGIYATIADFDCAETLFNNNAKQDLLNLKNKWLIFTSNFDQVSKKLQSTKLRLDSDVIFAEVMENNINLYDVYNPGFSNGGSLIIKNLGMIETSNATSHNNLIFTKLSFYKERRYLFGVEIKAAVVVTNQKPGQSLEDYMTNQRDKHSDNRNKLNYILFKAIKNYHAFDVSYITLKTEKHITKILKSKGADIGISAMLPSQMLLQSLDFLPQTYHLHARFILRNVVNYEGKNEYIDPLAPNVWYSTVVTTIIVIFVLKFVFFFDAKIYKDAPIHIKVNITEGKHWNAVIFDIFYILIQQGSTYEPETIAGRSILYAYLLLSVILFNYYSSIMVADLLGLPPPPYKDFNQLRRSKEMILGVQNESLDFVNYQPDNDLDTKNIQRIESYDLHTAIYKMRHQHFAYHALTSEAYSLIDKSFDLNEICDIDEVAVFKDLWMYAIIAKNSEYREMFTITHRRLGENAVLDYAEKHWLIFNLPCLANKDIRPAGFNNCSSAMYIFVAGFFLSVGIFFFEIAYFKGFKEKLQKYFPIIFGKGA